MGFVIKVDGPDGSGKSTLVDELAERIRKQGHSVVCTSEFGTGIAPKPGADHVPEAVSKLILDRRSNFDLLERQAIFLGLSLRQNRAILPELRNGFDFVVSDRSSLSCYAYSVDIADFWHPILDRCFQGREVADLTLVIEIDARASFSRESASFAHRRADAVEAMGVDLQHRVEEQYRLLVKQGRAVAIDGTGSPSDVADSAARAIAQVAQADFGEGGI